MTTDHAAYSNGLIASDRHLAPIELQPVRLAGRQGSLAGLYYKPAFAASAGDILYVPPFGEELNRCRAMVSMQARLFAQMGIGTLVLDPFGTGESAGAHGDATWSGWREDLLAGVAWLRSNGNGCTTLWGARLGAIMAAEIAALDPLIQKLMLWQPVASGKTFYTQFLRIRVAAELELPGGVKTTEELRQRTASGEVLQVSGYHVGPALAAGIEAASLEKSLSQTTCRLDWLEVLASETAVAPRSSTSAVEKLTAAGRSISFRAIIGPAFWYVHERMVAPALLQATTEFVFRELPASASAHESRRFEPQPLQPLDADEAGPREHAIVFPCGADALVGMLHVPPVAPREGVVIIVAGGPQYRAGAHRQFVSLARELAASGLAVLRFDLRGMGDSSGHHTGFEQSEADLRAAIDALKASCPSITGVALFGECESASGITFYAHKDARVSKAILVNPWVRTQEIQAKVIVRHHYARQLRSPEFWARLFKGKVDVRRSIREFRDVFRSAFAGRRPVPDAGDASANLPLPDRTAWGLQRFDGDVLVLMSGRDYIAREFDEVLRDNERWAALMKRPRITRVDIAEADHTFSEDNARRKAVAAIRDWLAR